MVCVLFYHQKLSDVFLRECLQSCQASCSTKQFDSQWEFLIHRRSADQSKRRRMIRHSVLCEVRNREDEHPADNIQRIYSVESTGWIMAIGCDSHREMILKLRIWTQFKANSEFKNNFIMLINEWWNAAPSYLTPVELCNVTLQTLKSLNSRW